MPALTVAWNLLETTPVSAGVEAWRVNEVEPRFVELYAPGAPDTCFFPGTVLELLDGAGVVRASVQPAGVVTCFADDTYFLFATSGSGLATDAALPFELEPAGGQVCVRSGALRYDCVRWGSVSDAVTDQSGPDDLSVAPAIPAGQALLRVADTDVVAADFQLGDPTPRGPNDGAPWFPPDAGPVLDAGARPDAEVEEPIDAGAIVDASQRPDARHEPPGWLFAEPGGGGCQTASGEGTSAAWLVLLALLARRRS